MSEKFFGAKLNINSNVFHQNLKVIKYELIPEKIRDYKNENKTKRFLTEKISSSAKIKDVKWTLANIADENSNIISGDIVKSFLSPTDSLVGTRTKKTYYTRAEKVHFFYFIEEELILCQTKAEITYENALHYFKKLIEIDDDMDNMIGDLILEKITNMKEFESELFSGTVRKIKLSYEVPNEPKTLNGISDALLGSHAIKGKFEMENMEDGITTHQEDGNKTRTINELFQIVENKFGSLEALVGPKGKHKTIKSGEFPASARIKESDLKDVIKIEKLKNDIVKHD